MISATIEAGDDQPLTFPQLLRRAAKQHGDRVFLVCDDDRITYAEAEARSRRLARGLIAAGAVKGAHVSLLHPNGSDFVVAAMAAARIGAVVVPFSTFSTPDELRWLLLNADPAFLFAPRAFRTHNYVQELPQILEGLNLQRRPPLVSAAAPFLRRLWFAGTPEPGHDAGWYQSGLEAEGESVSEAFLEAVGSRVSPADRLVIIHTSGSTGAPKGVVHIHGSLLRHQANLNQIRGYDQGDVLFSNSPFFWIGGFGYTFLATLTAGGKLVCSNATSAAETLDLIERERPNVANGYAQSVVRLAADPSFPGRDLSFIRRGNLYPIMPADVRPRDAKLRHGNYGATETGSTVTISSDEGDQPEKYRGSYGRSAPGFEAKIVDPETGATLGTDEIGELLLRGPMMMQGYYGKVRAHAFDADGWYRSGDFGRIDAEGYFYFKGRRGDIIKTAGANVSPTEAAAVLGGLVGDRQCLVLGAPDPERGQVVVAIVVAEKDADVDAAALTKGMKAKLSSYKVPRHILRLAQADVPVMSSGKIDMPKLRRLVAERL
jgi:acyl-CoA synthetase (AMP-forming)/AMP-acid ligase II